MILIKVRMRLLRIGHEVVGSLSGCIVVGLLNGCIVMVALASDLHCIERVATTVLSCWNLTYCKKCPELSCSNFTGPCSVSILKQMKA